MQKRTDSILKVGVGQKKTMPGKLSKEFKQDLEEMIGKGPKSFQLLYSIVRDGCDPDIFHRKCDNKGPTVTVLYNPKGSVYGFYTSLAWKSTGDWNADRENFLFQLQFSGERRFTKCLTKGAVEDIYFNLHNGPWSEAIRSFRGKGVVAVNGIFSLNGNMDGFKTGYYDTRGLEGLTAANGSLEVTELEVYSVSGKGHNNGVVMRV